MANCSHLPSRGEGVQPLQRGVGSRRSQVPGELGGQLGVDPRVQVIRGQTLYQAGFHLLAHPGVAPDEECGQHTLQGRLSGAEAGLRQSGVPGTVPTAGHQSGLGGHHRLVALDAGQRPPWPEPSDRAVHQVRPGRRQVGVAEAEPLGHTRPPALHHDVGGQYEVASPVAAFGTGQVDNDAALPPVPLGERRCAAVGVALGRLNLHDVGAEVAQHHGGQRTGQAGAEVDDRETVQCAPHELILRLVHDPVRFQCRRNPTLNPLLSPSRLWSATRSKLMPLRMRGNNVPFSRSSQATSTASPPLTRQFGVDDVGDEPYPGASGNSTSTTLKGGDSIRAGARRG